MNSEFCEKIKAVCKNVAENEPMSKHTTFKTGGAADLFVAAETCEEAIEAVKLCKSENVPYTICGNGSNLLVSDEGIEGVVISLAAASIAIDGTCVRAEAGALMSKIANAAMKAELSGFEFAAGIPGSIGGGIYMNAGAYGGELRDVIKSVTYLSEDGEVKTTGSPGFGYRTSMFTGTKCVILSCEIYLRKGDFAEIKERMSELAAKRSEKQPLSMPSAGSTFKRPEGHFAGALIEEARLKGFSIGGAAVSEKHAGFVVNKGGATTADIERLIKHIQKTVKEKFSVELEPEIKIIGKGTKE